MSSHLQVTNGITYRRGFVSILLSWMIFIGIDFLFHASLLSTFWDQDIPALKPLGELAALIPLGYLSFLLLTALIGYVFFLKFKTKPETRRVFQFGLVFASLFSLSNFLGLFSYVTLPLKHLVAFNFVYFIEIFVVTFTLYYIAFADSLKKSVLYSMLIFVGLIICGIIIQNTVATF